MTKTHRFVYVPGYCLHCMRPDHEHPRLTCETYTPIGKQQCTIHPGEDCRP